MRYTSREIALIGILSAINGVIEITLGGYLHILNFIFTGNFMVGLNLCVYIIGRKSVNKRGTILLLGFITAFLKLLFGYNLNASLFIFFEALLIEIIIDILGFNLIGTIISSIAVNLLIIIYKFIIMYLIGGNSFVKTLIEIIAKFSNYFNIDKNLLLLPFILIMLIYSLWGLFFGLFTWRIINSFTLSGKGSLY